MRYLSIPLIVWIVLVCCSCRHSTGARDGVRIHPFSEASHGLSAGGRGSDEKSTGVHRGLADSPWPKFRGDAHNTGQSMYVGARTNAVKWSFVTGADVWSGDVYGSPAIGADGTIYFGSRDHKVYAVRASDGKMKWSRPTGLNVTSSPAIGSDGTIYIGSGDKKLYALNSKDGSVKWVRKMPDAVVSSPALGADGTVYVGSLDKKVYALSAGQGRVKWAFTTEDGVWSSP